MFDVLRFDPAGAAAHVARNLVVQRWLDAGFRMLNVNSDAVFMRQQAGAVVRALTGERSTGPKSSSYA